MIDVKDFIGAKYKLHGRSKEEGFDCYGLVLAVEKRIGNELPDFDYAIDSPELFFINCKKMQEEKRIKKIQTITDGAIILFQGRNGERLHIGVYVGDGCFCHCNSLGVHLDKISTLDKKLMEIFVWQK